MSLPAFSFLEQPSPNIMDNRTAYDDFAGPTAPHGLGLARVKTKGPLNFRPWEGTEDMSMQMVHKFSISPYGSIEESCRHIPYNSGKKDFTAKTGRESFESK